MPNRSFRSSCQFLAEIKQVKIVDLVKFIGDLSIKHIKSFENICCWVRFRSPNRKLEKMIIDAIAL